MRFSSSTLGGYAYLLSGDSASFTVEWVLAQARIHPEASVVVLGNSTAAEGFRPNWFKSHGSGAVALDLGVPSGWIYLWQRMLEAADQRGVHPRAVVVMLTPEIISETDFDFLLNDLAMLKTVVDYKRSGAAGCVCALAAPVYGLCVGGRGTSDAFPR